MRLNLSIIVFVFFNGLFAQQPTFQSVWQIGSGYTQGTGNSVVTDSKGNVYTTGFFYGSIDCDPGPAVFSLNSVGGNDIFITKLDATGKLIWAKRIGGPNDDEAYSIAVDTSGNVYTTGYFEGVVDFNPSNWFTYTLTAPTTIGGFRAGNIFVSKLNIWGSFVWAKQMGGNGDDKGNSICLDDVGNIYTTGTFLDTADFDPGVSTFTMISSGYNVYPSSFISKLDNSGSFIWAKQFYGGINNSKSIKTDASGNVYTTGDFFTLGNPADFDPGPLTYTFNSTGQDVFISKLSSSGNFIWAKQISGNGANFSNSLAFDGFGNVYFGGSFNGTTDFDASASVSSISSAGITQDAFIAKYNSSGNFLWVKQFSGIGATTNMPMNSVVIDGAGSIYSAGAFGGSADFDPSPSVTSLTAIGYNDIYISKLDGAGNFLWVVQMGAPFTNSINPPSGTSNCLAVDNQSNIYLTGMFNGPVDFDPGPALDTLSCPVMNVNNGFLVKLSQNSVGIKEIIVNNSLVSISPNPNSGQFIVACEKDGIAIVSDFLGKVIFSQNVVSGKNILSLTDQSNGVYALRLIFNNEQFNSKIILSK